MTCRALRKYFILFFHSYRTKRLETPIVAPKPDSNRRPEDRSSFPRPTSHCPPTPVSCLRDSRSRSRRSQATNWPSRNDGHDCALDGVKRCSLRFVPDRDTVKVRPETPERVLQSPGSWTILVADRGDAWRDKARRGVVTSGDTALPDDRQIRMDAARRHL
ncbi:hypothetical protein ALC53_03945 [Atta colombica]|uniref:Uncharacterized protein n=1 Tax=Atta colombica TaxID=520822 RepID=A0A195BLC1_9HYME|nr:hypothetical protein ALC53_03945 [Atta colombica]